METGSRTCEVEVSTVGSSAVIDPETIYYQFGRSACALNMDLKILHGYRTHIYHELNNEIGGTYGTDDTQCINYVTADHVDSIQLSVVPLLHHSSYDNYASNGMCIARRTSRYLTSECCSSYSTGGQEI
jgi:hypothetical protein